MLLPSFLGFTASQILSQLLDYYSVKFDGTDDYIDCGSSFPNIGTTPCTIAVWAKISDNNLIQNFISPRSSSDGWSFDVNTGVSGFTTLTFYNKPSGGTIRCNFDTYDEWVNIVLVRGGSGNNAIYVNGVSQTLTVDTEVLSNPSPSTNLLIGATEATGSVDRFMHGNIAQIAVWDSILTSSEVLSLYNEGGLMDWRIHSGNYASSADLIGYWPLVAGSGTTAADHSTNGNDGTLTNGPTWSYSIPGLLQGTSYALSFDGTNDYVDSGDLSELEGATKLTISAWIKCSNLSNRGSVVSMYHSNSTQRVFLLDVNSGGSIRLLKYADNSGSNYYGETTDETGFDDGEWHHIVGVWDGGSGTSSIYVDGSKRSTTPFTNGSGGGSSIHSNSANLYIGAAQSVSTAPDFLFNGIIDQVFVWSEALTIDQIQGLYYNGNKFHPLDDHKSYDKSTALDLSIELEEGSGTSALDKSDNKNNGTLTNGPIWTTDVAPITSTSWFDKNSLSFDGTNDYINIPDSSSLVFGDGSSDNAFSVFGWIKVEGGSDFRFIQKGDFPSGTMEWQFNINTSDKLFFRLYDNNTSNYESYHSDNALSNYTGRWIHIGVTYNGNGNVATGSTFYVNGIEWAGSGTSTYGSYTAMHNSSYSIVIGRINTTYANGNASQVGIWNSALSSSEVLVIYNSGNPFDLNYDSGNYTSSDNLVGYWQFNENTGTALYDYSENGNDGTLTNGPVWNYELPGSAILEPKYSIDFDGTNDYIDCGSSFTDIGTTAHTFSVWVKITDDDTIQAFISARKSSVGWSFDVNTGVSGATNCTFYNKSDGGTIRCDFSTYDEWVHIVCVRGGSGNNAIYVNGVSQTLTADSEVLADPATSSNLLIGATEATGSVDRYMNGNMRDLVVWDTALSSSDVSAIYNSGNILPIQSYPSFSNLKWVWELSEGTSTTAYDLIGGNNGTLTNGPTWSKDIPWDGSSVKQANNYSVDFDGTNDYITISDHDDFSFGDSTSDSPFSISTWVNADNWVKFRILCKVKASAEREFIFTSNGNSHPYLYLYDLDGNNIIGRGYGTILNTGQWYHILATYDGSSTATGIKVFVDGVQVDDTSYNLGTYVAMHNTTSDLEIGGHTLVPDYANGHIKEVAIWDKTLSPNEISSIYNGGDVIDLKQDHGHYQSKDNLVGYWPLNEGSGTTATDNSGNGHNGTLTNGPTYSTDVP